MTEASLPENSADLAGRQSDRLTPVRRVQLYGQRCSGTNYLQRLIEQNLPGLKVSFCFGYKHSTPKNLHQPHDDCLFCVIYRDPYTWLQSLHQNAWHAHPRMRDAPFSEFIRLPWHCIYDHESCTPPDDPMYGKEMMHERHPESGLRYANVMQMRSDRIRRWQFLSARVKHFWWVQYESLCRLPELMIDDLAEAAGRRRCRPFRPVIQYKGIRSCPAYVPKRYAPISTADRAFITAELNWRVENRIGYFPHK